MNDNHYQTIKNLNKFISDEVERLAHEWLVSAKGADWTQQFVAALDRIKALEIENSRNAIRTTCLVKALEFYANLKDHPASMEFNGDTLVDFGTRARETLEKWRSK